jgi:predicted RNase H-like HicB family nuclease
VAISRTAPPSQRHDPYVDFLMHPASPTEVAQLDEENHPMRYTVVLEREDDGGYVASVPALPGCVSQGDTRSEALNNIREAIELYVEDCRDAGDPVPTEAGKEFVEIEAA